MLCDVSNDEARAFLTEHHERSQCRCRSCQHFRALLINRGSWIDHGPRTRTRWQWSWRIWTTAIVIVVWTNLIASDRHILDWLGVSLITIIMLILGPPLRRIHEPVPDLREHWLKSDSQRQLP